MPRILINALASTAGGGITYLRNVLPRLGKHDKKNSYTVLVPREQAVEYARYEDSRVSIGTIATFGGAAGRMIWEQTWLRSFISSRQIDVLVSLGNVALFRANVPQILFNRNDLYFSPEFEADLKKRGELRALAVHRLKAGIARASILHATINVTPTAAFAERIRQFDNLSEIRFEVLRFGFDREIFTGADHPLPVRLEARLRPRENCLRLLYVSHYNYYRNFETLIRALPLIKQEVSERGGKELMLVLTTDIRSGTVYGSYNATAASNLIDDLGLRADIAMLGPVDYENLHRLYRSCDLFVCPSYSESFGHTMLEAMASGAPVVSAGQGVHHEVCGDAAIYFDTFDEIDLAKKCIEALLNPDLRTALIEKGLNRSGMFSWDEHVSRLINLIDRCQALSPRRRD
jgi:glycosyltransferase involved in cell wall biosynthesis